MHEEDRDRDLRIKHLEADYSDEEIFEILQPDVRKWFSREFETFTPPQRQAIMPIQKGENVLLSSPSGTGKTLAAFLTIITANNPINPNETVSPL